MDGDVETLNVERLEHDLGGVLSILRRIQWRLGLSSRSASNHMIKNEMTDEEKVMILRLSAKILEDGLFPISLHLIPILDHTMSNRIVDSISLVVRESFVPNEEIEILDTPFRSEMGRSRA